MKKIKLKIILFCGISDNLLTGIKNHLRNVFNLEVESYSLKFDLNFAYNEKRRQYFADEILRRLLSKRGSNEKLLIVVDVDIYSKGLNFIFGLAEPDKGICIISLKRLRQQFYGLNEDESLFIDRIKKEATHELGHLFNLRHCLNKKCVMHFSNSIYDTDEKTSFFCDKCRRLLACEMNMISK